MLLSPLLVYLMLPIDQRVSLSGADDVVRYPVCDQLLMAGTRPSPRLHDCANQVGRSKQLCSN